MGVKELWTILAPAKKEVFLETLTGQTIAVDLSVWICENQGVKAVQGKVSKPHLRNLFFRISNLIQLGITLVFVVDGDPPELKWETISNRINSRYKGRGRGSTKDNKIGKPGRSHFKRQISECLELLDHLGVPYVQSKGEAEALCALLNQEGVVDGCITEDGDVFLYGATTVYKNFNLAGKNPVIDCYKMADIERQLGLTREALVALALFLGCDYVPRGVPGVGKVHALQLISQFQGSNILERFKRWANEDVEFQLSLPSKPAHCTRCHHIGSAQKHKTGGCPLCGRSSSCTVVKNGPPCTCDWHREKEEFDKYAPERDIMMKALQVPGFPQENVIEEFLNVKDKCPRHPLKFARPRMVKIMKFALEKLDWPEKYTREKVIDLVVFHDLQNSKEDIGGSENLDVDTIVKRRIRNGVPCLEVLWKLPDEWKLEEDEFDVISTIENFDLFKSVFPDVVEEFEFVEASKKENKKGKKKKTAVASSAEATSRNDYNILETVTDQLSGLVLQNKDTHESEDTHNLIVHNTDKLSGDRSCDHSHSPKRKDGDSPKRMNDDSSKEGLCLQKEKVNEVTNLNSLSDCSTSEQYHVRSYDKMFTSFEGKEQLNSENGTHVVKDGEDTFTHIPESECNRQSRRDEEVGQCSMLPFTSKNIGEMSRREHQSLDDSVVLSLAERLDLKMRQTVCRVNDMDKLGSDESGGSSGKSSVDTNKCKQQGKYERVGYLEQRNSHAERVTHKYHDETLHKVNSKQAGKVRQRLENVKEQNLSKVVSGDCVTYVSGLTSSSTMMCPELLNISTPNLSLVDGASDSTITQSSIGQCKMAHKGQKISSICPEVHDVSTPNVTLLEKEKASGKRHGQDKMLGKEETSGIRDSLEKLLVGSTKVEGNLEISEDIYDLCTPDVSLVNCRDERQEPGDISTMRPIGESEKGNSPMCSGSCDVMRAAKIALQLDEGGSFDNRRDSKVGQERSAALEPTELYDICTPEVSTMVDRRMDEVISDEDKRQDVIEISDDDDDNICEDSINDCIQDDCKDLKEHLWGGCLDAGDGESRGGEGGQRVRSTPECSIWEEPTALNINTPSQTMVMGTPLTSEMGNICMEERETWRHDSSDMLHDSNHVGNQYSQLRGSARSETLTGEEQCLLGDNGRPSPSYGLDGSTIQEKSMDHSLFQMLNFSLGISGWTFSPLSRSSSTGGCVQVNQSKVNEKADRKHLDKSGCVREKAESVDVYEHALACTGPVFEDEELGWQLNENVMAKDSYQRTVTREGSPPVEVGEGCGEKKLDKSDHIKQNGSLRKKVDQKQHAGHGQLIIDQPGVVKLMCNEKREKLHSGASVKSDRRKRCEGVMDRGEGQGRGLSYEEDHGEKVLREKSNDKNELIDTKKGREEKHQGEGKVRKDGGQSLTNEDLTKEGISQSYTSIKIQNNCKYGREIDVCADKENSPVSLMDRLRKKNARTRDILKSMELD